VLFRQPLRKNTLPQYAGVPLRCAVAIVTVEAQNTQVAAFVAAPEGHRNDMVNGQSCLARATELAPRMRRAHLAAQSLPRSVIATRLPARSVGSL
jgi:hypothetical protein